MFLFNSVVVNILQKDMFPQDVDTEIRRGCYAICLQLARFVFFGDLSSVCHICCSVILGNIFQTSSHFIFPCPIIIFLNTDKKQTGLINFTHKTIHVCYIELCHIKIFYGYLNSLEESLLTFANAVPFYFHIIYVFLIFFYYNICIQTVDLRSMCSIFLFFKVFVVWTVLRKFLYSSTFSTAQRTCYHRSVTSCHGNRYHGNRLKRLP